MENFNTELLRPVFIATLESKEQFPVDFDDAWIWLGYNQKADAKSVLTTNFVRNLDFSAQFLKTPTGGRPSEIIMLSIDCFKSFCMLAQTEKGKEVRLYYLAIEKELKLLKAQQEQSTKKFSPEELTALRLKNVEKAKSLLEDLGGLTDRDRIKLRVMVNNALPLESDQAEVQEQIPLSLTEIAQQAYGVTIKPGSHCGEDAHLGKLLVKRWKAKYSDKNATPQRAAKFMCRHQSTNGHEITPYVYPKCDWHLVGELLTEFGYLLMIGSDLQYIQN